MAISVEKHTIELRCPIDLFESGIPCQTLRVQGGSLIPRSPVPKLRIAQTAAALSLSTVREDALAHNLRELGYGDLYAVRTDSDRDKIGLYLASRTVGNTLETVAVLKGSEGDEWYSNFDVGYSAEHSGFARAADFAEQALGDYVFTRAIGTEPRFFITGYSRGGAVANILAKRLCDRCGNDDVYACTLASPAVTLSRRQARYNRIYNLIREEDFFTRIPPESWGYIRYGRDIILSRGEDYEARCEAMTGERIKELTKSETDHLLSVIRSLAPNVNAYYRRRRDVGGKPLSLYEFMSGVADLLAGCPDEAGDLLIDAIMSDYSDLLELLSAGADIGELVTCTGTPRCSIAEGHSPAAYLSAIQLTL